MHRRSRTRSPVSRYPARGGFRKGTRLRTDPAPGSGAAFPSGNSLGWVACSSQNYDSMPCGNSSPNTVVQSPAPPEHAALLGAKLGGNRSPEARFRCPSLWAKTTTSRLPSGGGAGVRRLMPRKLSLGFLKVAFCLPSGCAAQSGCWFLREGGDFWNVQGTGALRSVVNTPAKDAWV